MLFFQLKLTVLMFHSCVEKSGTIDLSNLAPGCAIDVPTARDLLLPEINADFYDLAVIYAMLCYA